MPESSLDGCAPAAETGSESSLRCQRPTSQLRTPWWSIPATLPRRWSGRRSSLYVPQDRSTRTADRLQLTGSHGRGRIRCRQGSEARRSPCTKRSQAPTPFAGLGVIATSPNHSSGACRQEYECNCPRRSRVSAPGVLLIIAMCARSTHRAAGVLRTPLPFASCRPDCLLPVLLLKAVNWLWILAHASRAYLPVWKALRHSVRTSCVTICRSCSTGYWPRRSFGKTSGTLPSSIRCCLRRRL
jgi:hypothetical protein